MALPYTVPEFFPRQIVKAADHMNPIRLNAIDLDSRLVTVESRTTDASTGNTALGGRVSTLETRTTNGTTGNTALGTRLSTVETRTTDATTGNTALGTRVGNLELAYTRPLLLKVSMAAATTPINGGATITWDSVPENHQNRYTVSGALITVPTGGVYEIFMQGVFDALATNVTVGIYATRNGDSGSVNGVASNERLGAPGQVVMQAVGRERFAAGDIIRGRAFTGAATNIRGTNNVAPYGGTYLSLLKIAD